MLYQAKANTRTALASTTASKKRRVNEDDNETVLVINNDLVKFSADDINDVKHFSFYEDLFKEAFNLNSESSLSNIKDSVAALKATGSVKAFSGVFKDNEDDKLKFKEAETLEGVTEDFFMKPSFDLDLFAKMISTKKSTNDASAINIAANTVATGREMAINEIDATIEQFVSGSTIESAADMFVKKNMRDDAYLVSILAMAALTSRTVVCDKNHDTYLIKVGIEVKGKLNYTMARLMGNMIFEANDTKYTQKLMTKIGGRSMISPQASKLDGDSAKIFDENRHKYSAGKISTFKNVFLVETDVLKEAKLV